MKVLLIVPYYLDKNKKRQHEIDYCIGKNIRNVFIDKIIVVCDSEINLGHNKKLTVINIGKRQMFSDLSNIGWCLNSNGINIISNVDIIFKEDDLRKILAVDFTNTVLALSRWDIMKNGSSELRVFKDSQDSWIWKGKLNVNGDFEMGKAGVDNRIAYEIGLNYNIVNPSRTIKSHHLHLSNVRNYKPKDTIPPPYLRVVPCFHSDKKIKRVLHIGLSGQNELKNMLSSFGEYIFFDWQKILKETDIVEMHERLVKISNEFRPDFTFMQLQTANVITPVVASNLHGFVCNWSGDVRQDIEWLRELGSYVDATCLSNETDTEQLREEGFNSWFFQIGFENKIFNPKGVKLTTQRTIHKAPDIVFMGNHYKDKFPLSPERYEIAHKLKKTYGNKFLLCGNGWDIDAIDLMNQPKKEAMVYRSCKIAINANHFIHKRFSSDRIFRIMGSGAFCLTRWYPNIEKDFIEGEHLRTFKDLDEMIYLINYYLKNEDERMAIAEEGCKFVHKKYTWMANKRLIEQIASFPQHKMKMSDKKILEPLSNKEWIKYLKEN